jgi:uncharacterized protein (TIGR02246 family)
MNTSVFEKEPIGAIVKNADTVFSSIVRSTQNGGSFNRVEWQLLNLLQEKGSVSKKELYDFLAFFEPEKKMDALINEFGKRGLASITAEEVAITLKGKGVFEEAFEVQEKIKEKALEGLTDTDYETTVSTIKKMVENITEFLPQEQLENITLAEGVSDSEPRNLERIKQVVQKMEQAHNQKDPDLLASLFAENAVFVNAAGVRLQGKEAILQSAYKVMKTFLARSYAIYHLSGIRFISRDVAIVDVNQQPVTVDGKPLPEETAGIPTYILKKNATGNWEIIAGQNTLVKRMEF